MQEINEKGAETIKNEMDSKQKSKSLSDKRRGSSLHIWHNSSFFHCRFLSGSWHTRTWFPMWISNPQCFSTIRTFISKGWSRRYPWRAPVKPWCYNLWYSSWGELIRTFHSNFSNSDGRSSWTSGPIRTTSSMCWWRPRTCTEERCSNFHSRFWWQVTCWWKRSRKKSLLLMHFQCHLYIQFLPQTLLLHQNLFFRYYFVRLYFCHIYRWHDHGKSSKKVCLCSCD